MQDTRHGSDIDPKIILKHARRGATRVITSKCLEHETRLNNHTNIRVAARRASQYASRRDTRRGATRESVQQPTTGFTRRGATRRSGATRELEEQFEK